MENINLLDIIVITLVTLLGLKGLFKGFTKEFFGLVGLIGGVFVASRTANDMGNLITGIIPMSNENTILLAGFIASLVVFWIIAFTLGNLFAKVLDLSGLGIFDQLFGFLFGAGKIFLIFSMIAYAVSQVKVVNDNIKPKVKDSIVFPLLVETGKYIIKLDGSNLKDDVSKNLDKAVNSTKEKVKELSKKEVEERSKELVKQLEETTSDKTEEAVSEKQ